MTIPAILPLFSAIGQMGAGLSAALSVGTTALGYVAESKAAAAQNAANDTANANARVQAINSYDQITMAGRQETDAASQKLFDAQVSRKKAVASATASASEAGVGGLSVDSLLTDIYGQEARIRDGVNQNLQNTQAQQQADRDGVSLQLQNTISTRSYVQKPSLAGAVLSGVTGIAGAYKDKIKVTSNLSKG